MTNGKPVRGDVTTTDWAVSPGGLKVASTGYVNISAAIFQTVCMKVASTGYINISAAIFQTVCMKVTSTGYVTISAAIFQTVCMKVTSTGYVILVHRTRKSDRKCSSRFFCLVLPVWYRTSGVLVLCLFAGQGYEKNNLLPVV